MATLTAEKVREARDQCKAMLRDAYQDVEIAKTVIANNHPNYRTPGHPYLRAVKTLRLQQPRIRELEASFSLLEEEQLRRIQKSRQEQTRSAEATRITQEPLKARSQTTAEKKPKPLKPPDDRDLLIFFVSLTTEQDGPAYAKGLTTYNVQPAKKSKWKNWPGTYELAYKKDEVWRERIRKERDRVKRRVKKYLRLSGRSWEDLKFSPLIPRKQGSPSL